MNNTTVEELKALYVKMGGNLTDTYEDIADGVPVADYVDIPDMLAALSNVAASGLPAVTEDDNNKVLAVVDGAWDLSESRKTLPSVGSEVSSYLLGSNGNWEKQRCIFNLGNVTSGTTQMPTGYMGMTFQNRPEFPWEIKVNDSDETNGLLTFRLTNTNAKTSVGGNTESGAVFKCVTVTGDGKLKVGLMKIPLATRKIYVEYQKYTLTPEV